MNIKNLKLTAITLMAAIITSCSGNSNKEETQTTDLTEETTEEPSVQSSSDEIAQDTETSEVETASSKENWEAFLNSYEGYIDQYIRLMKKAKAGDMSAMTEYAEYMQKATDLQEKMESAKNELSASQMARYMKLQTKLMKAAAEM
ncbi:DUF6591 domain-containing protein [Pseudopedobacter beijingensis]|uniref:DUF6591 domain-containing protein n=1 Tax=Pseudopedobacter beijingensis TaxID=1207056 RepID=A0ABW4I7M3_9SPHI